MGKKKEKKSLMKLVSPPSKFRDQSLLKYNTFQQALSILIEINKAPLSRPPMSHWEGASYTSPKSRELSCWVARLFV